MAEPLAPFWWLRVSPEVTWRKALAWSSAHTLGWNWGPGSLKETGFCCFCSEPALGHQSLPEGSRGPWMRWNLCLLTDRPLSLGYLKEGWVLRGKGRWAGSPPSLSLPPRRLATYLLSYKFSCWAFGRIPWKSALL